MSLAKNPTSARYAPASIASCGESQRTAAARSAVTRPRTAPPASSPFRWCSYSWDRRRGPVMDLEDLGHPPVHVLDPRLGRWVRRQEFGRPRARGLDHPFPQFRPLARIVARLRHQDQSDVVGLALVRAAVWQDCDEVGRRAEGLHDRPLRRGAAVAQTGVERARGGVGDGPLRHPLAAVARDRVAHLVSHDDREPRLRLRDRQNPV